MNSRKFELRGDLEVMRYLCSQPQTDLPGQGESYLWDATCRAPNTDAVLLLLGLESTEISDDMMDDVVVYCKDETALEALRQHPKTRQYMTQYDAKKGL